MLITYVTSFVIVYMIVITVIYNIILISNFKSQNEKINEK